MFLFAMKSNGCRNIPWILTRWSCHLDIEAAGCVAFSVRGRCEQGWAASVCPWGRCCFVRYYRREEECSGRGRPGIRHFTRRVCDWLEGYPVFVHLNSPFDTYRFIRLRKNYATRYITYSCRCTECQLGRIQNHNCLKDTPGSHVEG